MKSGKPLGSFAPHELQRFILPITISSITIMVILIGQGLLSGSFPNINLMIYGTGIVLVTLINNALIVRTENFQQSYGWLNAVLTGIGLGLLPYVVPESWHETSHLLIPLGVIAVAITSGRTYAYTTLLEILMINLSYAFGTTGREFMMLDFGMPFILSIVLMEAIPNVKHTTQKQIHRLEIINNFSLSWMGVLLTAPNVTGVIALASYQPNAFDSGDMQLLSNLAQHITLALDNTIRHAQVEEQARLDSMTGVYNHGYFLKKLAVPSPALFGQFKAC